MALQLSPAQLHSFHNSNGRFNLWHGPVRSGKSYVSTLRWIEYIARNDPPGPLFVFGRTLSAVKRNIVTPMFELLGDAMRYTNQTIQLWGRTIHCIGASDAKAEGVIRGSTSAGSYYDETTLLPRDFFSMSLSRMSLRGAKGFATTNPDSPAHWLKKDFMDRADELGWKMFSWSLDEATFLDPEFLAALKREHIGLFYRRFIKGEWVMAEGVIYDGFDPSIHVITKLPYASPDYYIIGVDYGTGNPTVFLLMGVKNMPNGKPVVCCEREYYYDSVAKMRQKTDAEYAEDLLAFVADIKGARFPGDQQSSPTVMGIYVDPSAASFKVACSRLGLPVRDADNSVLDGIRFQATMLANGQYTIHRRCTHTIEEYGSFVWDYKKQLLGIDAPIKAHDHTKDAERYNLYSHFGGKRLVYSADSLRM
ncbi:MAG: PBSX family phage terminase large subunit [Candidatus Hydrogenedentes bacterium]|nr:PBSX family phage terminase large subunit [Candidatus Hydrogenedentota bacterium]